MYAGAFLYKTIKADKCKHSCCKGLEIDNNGISK